MTTVNEQHLKCAEELQKKFGGCGPYAFDHVAIKYKAQILAQHFPKEQKVGSDFYNGIEHFACWLLDHHEGKTVKEELLRQWACDAWKTRGDSKCALAQEQKVDERLLEALHAINDYCESDIVGNGRDINNINRIAKNALNIKENQNTSEKESEKEVMQTEDARPIHGTPSAVDSRGATAEKDAQSFIEAKDCYYCCVYGPSNCAVHKPSL